MLQALAVSGQEAGLSINTSKSKVMVVGDLATLQPLQSLSLNGVQLERVSDFVYLGSQISSSSAEIDRRIKAAAFQCGNLRKIWSAPLQLKLKIRVFRALIEPILFYACESWTTTQKDLAKLTSAHSRLLRRAIAIPWFWGVSNADLFKTLAPLTSADITVEERRYRFVGHVARFHLNPVSLQPLNDLLWHETSRNTRRVTARNCITFHRQLLTGLGLPLDDLSALRELAEGHKDEYSRFCFERNLDRWTRWTKNAHPQPQPALEESTT